MASDPLRETTPGDRAYLAGEFRGLERAARRVEAAASAAAGPGEDDRAVVLRALARAMRAEFGLPPGPEDADAG